MRRFVVMSAAAIVIATPLVARAQVATLDDLPPKFLASARVTKGSGGTMVTPAASLARPGDAGVRMHSNHDLVVLDGAGPGARVGATGLIGPAVSPAYQLETPGSLACLYGQVAVTAGCTPSTATTLATGGGKAIAIVNAYHYPTALADLATYSQTFGLPVPDASTFVYINLGTETDDGWASGSAVEVQVVHALAPQAKIILVQAATNQIGDLYAALARANQELQKYGGGQLLHGWTSEEFWGPAATDKETYYDRYYTMSNVTYIAATGNDVVPTWPATSQRVLAVGGTTIARAPWNYGFVGEDSWSDNGWGGATHGSGAGYSTRVAKPSWQTGNTTGKRGIPDIAAIGSSATPVYLYFTIPSTGFAGWFGMSGTGVAASVVTGIVNASGHFWGSAETQKIYAAKTARANAFRVSRTGDCGVYHAYMVAPGWNPCTGVGSPWGKASQ